MERIMKIQALRDNNMAGLFGWPKLTVAAVTADIIKLPADVEAAVALSISVAVAKQLELV